ncbi:sap62 Pre-mRNA-splicing factor sap62 [Candida maltosa Xu316]
MDYSERVNSKKGAGGIASNEDINVQTKKRVQELLATHVLDLDNDPYVFRNHLGMLECKLCLTTHINESSYISHLGGRKHHLNLERRRILDEKQNKHRQQDTELVEKRHWKKIGKPTYKITKIRDPDSLKITVDEPMFKIMSYHELTSKNQNNCLKFIEKTKEELSEEEDDDDTENLEKKYQYLVISAEPYDNVAIIIPSHKKIDKPREENKMSDSYWWHWDIDTKEFFLQFLYK